MLSQVEYKVKGLEADIAKARKRLALIDRIFGCAIGVAVVLVGVVLPLIVR